MDLAIVCWDMVGQLGGIATHLNNLRLAAIEYGDTCDILYSAYEKRATPGVFKRRKKIQTKDNWIWCDGELPQHLNNIGDSVRFLNQNYDAVCYGFLCPSKTKHYNDPYFAQLVADIEKPQVGWVMDGNFSKYPSWVEIVLLNIDGILCPLETYAKPIREYLDSYTLDIPIVISAFPFFLREDIGEEEKSEKPLLVWPNQWKSIKGIHKFIEQVPNLTDSDIEVELYSCGIDYYRMAKKDKRWGYAIGEDRFGGRHGKGEATYFGTVEHKEMLRAFQRAHFTCNFQGINSREETYRNGSYNNCEVEALYYGACPVLHESTINTAIPKDIYLRIEHPGRLRRTVVDAVESGFALDEDRQTKAREFVLDTHLASNRYLDMRNLLFPKRK